MNGRQSRKEIRKMSGYPGNGSSSSELIKVRHGKSEFLAKLLNDRASLADQMQKSKVKSRNFYLESKFIQNSEITWFRNMKRFQIQSRPSKRWND